MRYQHTRAKAGATTVPELRTGRRPNGAGPLREMLAGAPLAAHEVIDVNFALIATAARPRNPRRAVQAAEATRHPLSDVRGLIMVVLNFLMCMAYVLLNLAEQARPLTL